MSRVFWLLIAAIGLTFSSSQLVAEEKIQLARFDIDVTPPVGSMMAYDRVRRIDELGLRCRGIVLLNAGKPVVLCAVDWIGIGNESHDAFRKTIATAAGTTPDRVAVQTLHQHDAPRCDFTAESILNEAGVSDLGAHEGSFAREVLKRLNTAVKQAIQSPTEITHAAIGNANVEKVASNRRIQDETGKVVTTRYTTCRDAKIRALPEGIIDPVLTTVSFWNKDTPVAVLSYYACHPQSYYRTGIPSPDFPGIARFMRGQDVPDVLHVHFNGAGGNIGAGKYNDGSKENRMLLAGRVADGMKRSFESAKKFPISKQELGWYVAPVALPLADHLVIDDLREQIENWNPKDYWGSPEQLAWALRCKNGHKIELSCLKVGDARILHMPGELFVEYQLAAKKLRPKLSVAMAAYGDYGPGYIGTAEAYGQGGYETSARASKVGRGVEKVLMDGVKQLLDDADSIVGNFSQELPRIPPTSPQDALQSFQVADGYEMQLVACEPLIGSPVAIEWDANGRMFVCEMRGYSEDRDDAVSTIGLLTDTDDDGIYDERTEFASGLLWPTAIFPYDGGLFVGDAPHIYYMKDTDGDGRADERKIVLTGFGVSNVQGLMNSMRWDLTNGIHLACSSVGGSIRTPESKEKPVNIRGRDILFDPQTFEFVPTSGAAQHGMCFDDWGRKFASSNSNHIMQVMYEDHHIARNPHLRAPPARISIATDGPQAEVYRTSPVEPWRIVRTRLRVAGKVRGPVEGGGRAAGYFTGATGITIYRGDAWLAKHKGLAIVGDVGSNLIHRKRLSKNGIEFIANRMDDRSEFVTSTDIWFRPAQFANAPDGSLHVIDVCREVIEHPKSLPPDIKKHLDLTAGRDRGRIYRIAPKGFKPRPTPKLKNASTRKLVALLEHPNAWHRETSARLLFERQDKSAVGQLESLVSDSSQPLARMHALYVLSGLDALKDSTIGTALGDDHPQVRRHAVRLAERAGSNTSQLAAMADDNSQDVRVQIAYALGESELDPGIRDRALVSIVRADNAYKWTQVAAQSSLSKSAAGVFGKLISDSQFRSASAALFLSKLGAQISQQNDESEIRRVVSALSEIPVSESEFVLPILGPFRNTRGRKNSVLKTLEKQGALEKFDATIDSMFDQEVSVAANARLPESRRVGAIKNLVFASFDKVGEELAELIDNRQSHAIQKAALLTLGTFDHPSICDIFVDSWANLSPSLRSAASEILLAKPERTLVLFDAIDAQGVPLNDLPRARLQWLSKSQNKDIARRAKEYLDTFSIGRRSDVLSTYKESLAMKGDVENGRDLFKKNCSACHKAEGIGYELGPNLATMKTRGAESILVNVLDPSREVNPQYLNYVVLTESGKTATGMIVSETANTITLRRGEGVSDMILRSEIDQLKSTSLSIMPEGLEKSINKQAMADLIAYVMQLK